MKIELSNSERDLIVLALAKLSLFRPGWHPAFIGPLVDRLDGRHNYETYRLHGPDPLPKGRKFKFRYHMYGADHEETIESEDFAAACLKLGRLHAERFRPGVPKDFRIDFASCEEIAS